MKDEMPNQADLRATKQLNFIVALMYALPITVVGLKLCMMSANLAQISTSFLVAMSFSLMTLFVGLYLARCVKPSSIIVIGFIITLTSSFFMLDYKGEEANSLQQVENRLVIGLGLAASGFTLSTLGIEK